MAVGVVICPMKRPDDRRKGPTLGGTCLVTEDV